MPRYFFDIRDGGRTTIDREGTELKDVEHAREEALETLGQIAKDRLPDGDPRDFIIAVRDDADGKVLTATLSLRVDREA